MKKANVDYSKWDKLVVSDDEDDVNDNDSDDERARKRREPSVTKFDRPQSLTLKDNEVRIIETQTASSASTSQPPPTSATSSITNLAPSTPNYTRNGADCGDFMWSQTKDEVQIAVPIPASTKARAVAVDVKDRALSVKIDGTSILSFELEHAVDDSADALAGCWRLTDDARSPPPTTADVHHDHDRHRLLLIALQKKTSVPGLVHWWPRVRRGDERAIDVQTIADRRSDQQTFAQVWDEAHREFRVRVANRPPPHELSRNVDDDNDNSVDNEKKDGDSGGVVGKDSMDNDKQ